jgi:hypothetical protein
VEKTNDINKLDIDQLMRFLVATRIDRLIDKQGGITELRRLATLESWRLIS